jgi:hypothetical protein
MKIIIQDDDGNVLREEILSSEEISAWETDTIDIPEWISNAVREKARRRIDHIVTMSGRGSKHTDADLKLEVVASLKAEKHPLIESAKARVVRLEAAEKVRAEARKK